MKRRGEVIVLLFFLLLFCGCGKKTRPVPPQTKLPSPVNDLQYTLDENGVVLTWTPPHTTRTGDRLEFTPSYVIFRAEVSADNYCPDCPVRYTEQKVLESSDLAGTTTMTYGESDLISGYRYYYKVAVKMGAFFHDNDSNTVSFWWQVPSKAPENFAIEAGLGQVTLSWQSPGALIDGSPVTGVLNYQVYRSDDGLHFIALGKQLSILTYVDREVRSRTTYWYQVRAVRVLDDTSVPGVASRILSTAPRE